MPRRALTVSLYNNHFATLKHIKLEPYIPPVANLTQKGDKYTKS